VLTPVFSKLAVINYFSLFMSLELRNFIPF